MMTLRVSFTPLMNRFVKSWLGVSVLIVGGLAACAWKLPIGYAVMAVGDIVQTLLPIALTLVMALNAFRSSGRTRAFWAIASGGAALWAVANASWMQYEVFL